MKLAELDQSAQRYLPEQSLADEALSEAKWAKIQEALEEFKVREKLELIRDEVWKEGEIVKTTFGLSLGSDTLPRVYRCSDYRGIGLGVSKNSKLYLRVEGSLDVNDDDGKINPYLYVYGSYILGLGEKTPSVTARIKELGLQRGLDVTTPSIRDCNQRNLSKINLAGNSALNNSYFDHLIMQATSSGSDYECRLPGDARNFMNSFLDQFPSVLREKGEMSSEEVREWGHTVRGSSRIYRAADKALARVGLGLPV